MNEELVPVTTFLQDLLGTRPRSEVVEKQAAQYGVKVVGRVDLGRGPCLMMTKAQADVLLKEHADARLNRNVRKERDEEANCVRVDRLEAVIAGQTEAINLLLKSNNLLVAKLDAVLAQLGVTSPSTVPLPPSNLSP